MLFSKFAFWLPFISFLLILFEIIGQPAKSLGFAAIDPLFGFIRSLLPNALKSRFFLLPLHFLLALVYGFTVDALIKKIKEIPENG